jgi:putative acetyltransferase
MPISELHLAPALTGPQLETVRALFREYEKWLGISLCFQGFEQELATLPGDYAPPRGRLFLATVGGEIAGCVALRALDDATGEMKRLYLREALRGRGLGRQLAIACIDAAREAGYAHLRLDTLPVMREAIALYRSLGFRDVEPYRANPIAGALYMELDLR